MNADPSVDVVRTAVDVPVPPARAFAVFTAGLDTWWNRGHHLLDGEPAEVWIEPRVGGAVRERTVDGRTCDGGRVLRWEPDEVFAFSWPIGPDWAVPAPDAPTSRVTVTFTPTGAGTRVELVHDRIDRHGDGWEPLRDAVAGPGGRPSHLAAYARATG
ncbi:SRPBCC domain-containing protein [Nakamurella deserti]|uniref:SRPBCC domain-containing protein n=1 Tax=Nakamurella deserti TaxID=2164074 RepID=UPI000DBE0905|nr:SRPBCC domain-containing protein [Nakamurella deserti]